MRHHSGWVIQLWLLQSLKRPHVSRETSSFWKKTSTFIGPEAVQPRACRRASGGCVPFRLGQAVGRRSQHAQTRRGTRTTTPQTATGHRAAAVTALWPRRLRDFLASPGRRHLSLGHAGPGPRGSQLTSSHLRSASHAMCGLPPTKEPPQPEPTDTRKASS